MPLYFSPVGNDQTFDANGDPLNAGQIETYIAGSSTPLATFTDDAGGTLQSNPIILNSLGYPTLGPIWLTGGQSYKFIIKDAGGATLRTIDDISGVNDASVSQSEWVTSGFVPTYINATSFSVPGDQTAILQIGRRLRTTNTSGLIYSTITNSVFAAGITTVTVSNDSGVLDAGLTIIDYALLAANPLSVPNLPGSKITGSITSSGMTMASDRLLGRTTASTGAIEEIQVSGAGVATLTATTLAFTALRGYIAGLTMSTAGSSATMSIAAGQATDSMHAYLMSLAASISKTTEAWAVGSGNGGLDTGSIANNTWYHFHLIKRLDTGVVDVLFSLSATAPTMPANYTQLRRIGAGRTNGSAQWLRFFQTGDLFLWDNLGSLDYDGLSTTSATLTTLTVPTGIKVRALMNILDSNAASTTKLYLSDPDMSDVVPSTSAWPLGTTGAAINGGVATAQVTCVTNVSAQIRQRSTRSDSAIRIATMGWTDTRGRA